MYSVFHTSQHSQDISQYNHLISNLLPSLIGLYAYTSITHITQACHKQKRYELMGSG